MLKLKFKGNRFVKTCVLAVMRIDTSRNFTKIF